MGISEDNADQGTSESESDRDSWKSTTTSSPDSATGDDCLLCLDTEEAIVKSAHRSPSRRCRPPAVLLSKDSEGMPSWSRSAVVARQCEEVTTKPFKQSGISLLIRTTAPSKWAGWQYKPASCSGLKMLLMWRISTHSEHEAEVNGRKKTLVQSLKQFHAHYYWQYKKSMTHTMVSLQGHHLGDAFRHPSISSGIGRSHSSTDASNWVETWRQLPSTSMKCTTRQWLYVTFAGHFPAWLH